jgi:penicillin-binding protein 1C
VPSFLPTVWARLRQTTRRYPKTARAGLTVWGLWLTFLGLDRLAPLPTPVVYARVVTARDGTVLHAFLSPDDKWRMKTELAEITPELRAAFLHKEDQYFYYHPGVNPLALARAAANNLWAGRKTSGASTITMQVARLLEPKTRTYWHKLVEIFRALQLEWHYSKDEILQLYLNLVPYGGNIEGVKAASLLYFGRLPDKLSLAQITTLAIVPNRPTSLALGRHNDRIQQARDQWLARFQADGVFPAADLAAALAEPLQVQRQPAPVMAAHFARFAHQQQPSQQANLRTTLRADFQAKVEELTAGYVRSTKAFNIHNACVLVIDNQHREVLAYLGSPNFADGQHGGQVDGVRAYRSPGSALKPFIYAAAFDQGLITPRSLITDVPTDFAGYAPENYNRSFNGQVSAETALANSLNVPAVKLLHQLSVNRLTGLLKQAKFQEISKKEKFLGLSLALGGCGVSLWEMAGLYAALPNQGYWQPLQWLADDQAPPLPDSLRQTALVSPSAAYVVSEILTKVNRPELPADYERNPHVPKIAWKTGTSYGRRDAWSIGYNAKYTVAVWVGNFSGEGSPELTGAGIATPLLFKLFNALDYNAPIHWLAPPEALQFRLVCAESGQVPESFCENLVQDYFLPGVSSIKKCEHSRPVFTSPDEKISYCSECLPASGYKKKMYPNLPPEMVAFNLSNKVAFMPIPPHNPACTRVAGGQAPVITSPVPGREYLTADEEGIELLLSCNVANEVKKVYWYVDNKFYRTAQVGEKVFFKPQRGEVQLSCSDDQGRNTNVRITVK